MKCCNFLARLSVEENGRKFNDLVRKVEPFLGLAGRLKVNDAEKGRSSGAALGGSASSLLGRRLLDPMPTVNMLVEAIPPLLVRSLPYYSSRRPDCQYEKRKANGGRDAKSL